MDILSATEIAQVETGLALFAKSLSGEGARVAASDVELHEGYRSGIIASVVHLHATFYSQHYGFCAVFERMVATEVSAFMGRIDNPRNTTFSAYAGDELLGSVSLDGEDLGDGMSHLRWFIVSPRAHGLGIGNLLLSKAKEFVDEQAFDRTRLWTFEGLDAARHLYEKHGFKLAHQTPGTQWGTKVTEQEFVRQHGA